MMDKSSVDYGVIRILHSITRQSTLKKGNYIVGYHNNTT